MKLHSIFLGKPIHWLPWPIIAVLFIGMNKLHLHVTQFNTFAFVLLGVAAAVVAYVVFTTGRDEQVTREPIPQDGGPVGTESED
jgi:hypothetical protein